MWENQQQEGEKTTSLFLMGSRVSPEWHRILSLQKSVFYESSPLKHLKNWALCLVNMDLEPCFK